MSTSSTLKLALELAAKVTGRALTQLEMATVLSRDKLAELRRE